jgi:hypothetical protein
MRRIFLVLAVLAILVATALPTMAQNRGGDNWDNNNWGHNDNDWDHNDNDWDHNDNDWDHNDNDWGRPSFQPCFWSPWWGWWWNPCFGWWAPWW